MAQVQGIDTGSWRVRVVTMEGAFRRLAIRDVQEIAVQSDEAGVPMMARALESLRDSDPGWDAAERVMAWPLDLGAVRLVRLPFTDRGAIARALPAEIEAHAPYDLDSMLLATRIVDAREGASRSVAFIVPREGLRARLELLKATRCEPRQVVVDVDALSAYAEKGVQAIVDVGHRRTLIALCEDGKLVGGRIVPSGGAEVTEAIAGARGVTLGEAEEIKHAARIPDSTAPVSAVSAEWATDDRTEGGGVAPEFTDPARPRMEQALLGAVDTWVAEVRAELVALEDELGLGVDEILLCGGGARLEGLRDRLAGRVGVPARSVVVPGGYATDCALAVALARVGAGEVKAIDLRTGIFAFKGHAERMLNVVGYVAVSAGFLLVAGVALFATQYWDAHKRLAELDTKIADAVTGAFPDIDRARLTEPSMAVAILQERVGETQARVDALGSLVSGIPPTLELLNAISVRMPTSGEARIDVRELTIAPTSVSFKAETDSYEMASKIEESLRREERFSEAQKGEEKKVGDAVSFILNIPLGESGSGDNGEGG